MSAAWIGQSLQEDNSRWGIASFQLDLQCDPFVTFYCLFDYHYYFVIIIIIICCMAEGMVSGYDGHSQTLTTLSCVSYADAFVLPIYRAGKLA